jgi:hypothetical protein
MVSLIWTLINDLLNLSLLAQPIFKKTKNIFSSDEAKIQDLFKTESSFVCDALWQMRQLQVAFVRSFLACIPLKGKKD